MNKLIEPIESFRVVGFRKQLCEEPEVRELEQQRDAMLEVLIKNTIHLEKIPSRFAPDNIYLNNIIIIEKAANKSFKEIRSLCNEYKS